MGENKSQVDRGFATRERVMRAGCDLLRRDGLGAVGMRAVAEKAKLSHPTLQFHYGTHDKLLRSVIRFWADDVTRRVTATEEDKRGLPLTLELCQRWARLLEVEPIPWEALRLESNLPGHDSARGMFLTVLGEWVDLTTRSLQQARVLHQLKNGVDLWATAIELHRLLWSSDWVSALYGGQSAKRRILQSLWEHLANIARDPASCLPTLDALMAGTEQLNVERPVRRELSPEVASAMPTWRLFLSAADPLFHAFERHELLGDSRTFLHRPEVLPEDEEKAKAYRAVHPDAELAI